jgi:hypothetical protein
VFYKGNQFQPQSLANNGSRPYPMKLYVQGAYKKYSQHWDYWQKLNISSLNEKIMKELGSFELLEWWKGFTKRISFVQCRLQSA